MPVDPVHAYEAMVLFPQASVSNLQSAVDHVLDLLQRGGAELISFRKWDERRLTYEIRGNKRGVYFLAYFRAKASQMVAIERNFNLSEQILRTLLTRADHLTDEQMAAVEGRRELADEIRLRGTQPRDAAAPEPDPVAAGARTNDDDLT
jgi:small subunit ribosomal protein S6